MRSESGLSEYARTIGKPSARKVAPRFGSRAQCAVLPMQLGNAGLPFSTDFRQAAQAKVKDAATFKKPTFRRKDIAIFALTFTLLIGATFSVFWLRPDFEAIHISRLSSWGGVALLTLGASLLAFKITFLLYLLVLFIRYKPVASVSDEALPTCTVIVPAYNEGKLVWSTLLSLVQSDYPAEKLQLIAIDDGSLDDTWQWMLKAKAALGDRVSIYQQASNQGKRHALYRGFNMGSGEVFVTVDSDSIVKKDTLRNLVSPFVTNEKCGAVAGNVRVLNNEQAMIPRMLNVSFVFSFEFVRSAQSALGTVLCTPGALAAYRAEAVMDCLPEWIDQTFMGQRTDIGEDRAMTNMILKRGYHVLFQKNAYVLTNIPEKYRGLYKMFIRWERSNVRENIMMAKFAFSAFRTGPKAGSRFLLVNQWLGMVMAYPLLCITLVFFLMHPVLFLSASLFGILIISSLPAMFYARKYNVAESIWAYAYSIFYTFGLFWITPYAIATASRRGWLTRGLSEKK